MHDICYNSCNHHSSCDCYNFIVPDFTRSDIFPRSVLKCPTVVVTLPHDGLHVYQLQYDAYTVMLKVTLCVYTDEEHKRKARDVTLDIRSLNPRCIRGKYDEGAMIRFENA